VKLTPTEQARVEAMRAEAREKLAALPPPRPHAPMTERIAAALERERLLKVAYDIADDNTSGYDSFNSFLPPNPEAA
jgi:hypothetical protein